jgi:hypothetical protein
MALRLGPRAAQAADERDADERERTRTLLLSKPEADWLANALEPHHPHRGMKVSASPDLLRTLLEGSPSGNGRPPSGTVEVIRLPAALRAPETWEIRITGLSREATERIETVVNSARQEALDRVR